MPHPVKGRSPRSRYGTRAVKGLRQKIVTWHIAPLGSMGSLDFRHELLLVLNYGDPQALRRLLQMRFPEEAAHYLALPDETIEKAFHKVRGQVQGVRVELAQESRKWLDSNSR